jgi:3-oxoacyl-[acyl-carrier protein] reductase
METLRGKVALVSGGSRGIGLAIARALVAEAFRCRSRAERRTVAARARNGNAGPSRGDARADAGYDEIERAVSATVGRFGGLDLANNAGVGILRMSPR